jgi:DNA replication protein DnaC
MERLDFEKTIANLHDIGFSPIPETVNIHIPNSTDMIRRGISYFTGSSAKWNKGYEKIASWLDDNKGRGLIVNGTCGLGKTLICSKIIPILINFYCKKIITIVDAQTLNEKLDILKKCKLLMIDDIGTENESVSYGNRRQAFAEIVDNAEKCGNLLIITTNLSGEEIITKYGVRVGDRLSSITYHVSLSGKSMRI